MLYEMSQRVIATINDDEIFIAKPHSQSAFARPIRNIYGPTSANVMNHELLSTAMRMQSTLNTL